MSENTAFVSTLDNGGALADHPAKTLGETFLAALAARDFASLAKLYQPEVRFRAMVPSGERMGHTAGEAVGWLERWFGACDTVAILQSTVKPVFDRLYFYYRLRVHDSQNGWRVIEQHAYSIVQDGQIADMWLICSGFRPEIDNPQGWASCDLTKSRPRLGGDVFYDAGAKGCADGPMDEIARLLKPLSSGQTLEIHATSPSAAGDLFAWCHLTGHALVKQEGDYYLIQHK